MHREPSASRSPVDSIATRSLPAARGGSVAEGRRDPRRAAADRLGAFAVILAAAVGGGCSDTMKLESAMELDGAMKLDGGMKLEGVMRIDGPIQMQVQMQGPRVEYSGVYISEALFERVEVGETTSDWVLAVFGEPTGQASLNDGTEIWKWAYIPLFEEKPLMALLNTGGEDEPTVTQSTTFLHLRSSLVIDKWRD